MRVVRLDPLSDPRWHAYVSAHPARLVYHDPAWLRVLCGAFGYRAVGLAAEDAHGRLMGVLPLVYSRGLLTGRRLISLPHTPVAGPLACEPWVGAALIKAAADRVRHVERLQLQVRTTNKELSGFAFGVCGVPWRPTYVLELTDDPSELRFGNSRNHGAIKRAVNKAARSGVQVVEADREDQLRSWYHLYLDTMRWHGLPPPPYQFFRLAWRELRPRGMLRLLLAEHPSGLLAGSLYLHAGHTVFYAYNGRRREALDLRPNDALHWRAIHDACREGFRFYDFGEVEAGNRGLTQFKSKWGTERRQLYRYYYPVPRELESGTFDQNASTRHLVNAAWRRLPRGLTEQLGGWLYCHL